MTIAHLIVAFRTMLDELSLKCKCIAVVVIDPGQEIIRCVTVSRLLKLLKPNT